MNSVNELQELSEPGRGNVYRMSYDKNGNQTSRIGQYGRDGCDSRNYTWDAANRLISIDYLDSTSGNARGASVLTYDGFGRLVGLCEKEGNNTRVSRIFVWAGNDIVQERDAEGNIVKEFFLQGFATLRENCKTRLGLYFYGRDQLGSVRNLTTINGVQIARFDYGPYGEVGQGSINEEANLQSRFCGSAQTDFAYAGLFHHDRSGLDFAARRVYDPTIKRWLSNDPIGEFAGTNLYAYAANNPICFVDPSGLVCWANLLNASAGIITNSLGLVDNVLGAFATLPEGPVGPAIALVGIASSSYGIVANIENAIEALTDQNNISTGTLFGDIGNLVAANDPDTPIKSAVVNYNPWDTFRKSVA